MQYNSNIKLGKVVLNVNKFEEQIYFYKNIIGLLPENLTDTSVDFVVKGSKEIILSLRKVDAEYRKRNAGLFHTAILVPSRSDLGNVLQHLLNKNINL